MTDTYSDFFEQIVNLCIELCGLKYIVILRCSVVESGNL